MCLPALLCATAVAAAGFYPTPVGAKSTARVFKMVRQDMRISFNVKGGRIVRAQVKAIEHCGQGKNTSSGFLNFKLFPVEAIPLRKDGSFHFGESFDDARGSAEVLLNGAVGRRAITGIFAFKNHQDTSCGTGRPGHRKVQFRATLQG
jgi:hypothetical protein